MNKMLFGLLLSISWLVAIAQPQELDRSGPTIALQSEVYQLDGKWYCPLCRQKVENRDRFGMDLKLCLSEWHDVFIDQSYFHDKIRYITDEELVNSLQITSLTPALQAALIAKDYNRVSTLLHEYFAGREDNKRLSTYDSQNKKYFITIAEFLQEILADSSRYNNVVRSAHQFYNPEQGYSLFGKRWGRHIDFNYNYPHVSKWGVHYLTFIDDQINYFLIKRDPATAKAFDDVFNQWYNQLDSVEQKQVGHYQKSYDFIWYELGLANRLQRFIDGYRVFARHISAETNKRMLKIILGSARWLNQCLKQTPFHPYNWQTHTSFTLSYAAFVFPEFNESSEWLARGKQNIIHHLENDIRDDGGYIERTPSYAAYMFSIFYRYMMMLLYFDNDPSLRDKYLSRLEKYIEFFVLTHTPLGVNAPFNDASRSKALVPLFKEMGEFFHRGDFIGAIRHEFPLQALASLAVDVTEPQTKSINFPDSKFAVMRDSWDPNSYFLIVNYGEWQNHTHYDQLDFEIYANGIPIALDAGIGKLSYIDSLHVTWYKHPLSHNMITINQAIPEKRDMPGYDIVWSPLLRTEFFAATHDGYVPYQKAKHRRHIIFSKNKYWVIIDEINTAKKDQQMDFNFHTPCSMIEIDDGFLSIQDNGFLIKQDHRDAPAISKIKSRGWADLRGLANEPPHREIDWLIFRKRLGGDPRIDRMATLIYPFASKQHLDPANISIEKLDMKNEAAVGYLVKTKNREDIVILSDGKYRKFTDTIKGDFKYGFFSSSAGGIDYAGFSSVSRFKIDGLTSTSFKTKRDYEFKR